MDVLKSVGTTSPASARASTKRYAQNPANKAKLRAKWKIQSAKRSGKLKAPEKCPRCGRAVKLDWHHDQGHSKSASLKGKWLCRLCHSAKDPKRHGAAMARSMKHAKSNA